MAYKQVRHEPSLTLNYHDNGLYKDPCIGIIHYAGKDRQLFKFQFTPKGKKWAPEYVLINGHCKFIKFGKPSETEPYSHNGCAASVY